MRTKQDVLEQIAYHPATKEVAQTYGDLRDVTMGFIEETWERIPDGPEKTLAYRHLQQFLMYANLAVALTTPADLTNHHVARVLPPEDA